MSFFLGYLGERENISNKISDEFYVVELEMNKKYKKMPVDVSNLYQPIKDELNKQKETEVKK